MADMIDKETALTLTGAIIGCMLLFWFISHWMKKKEVARDVPVKVSRDWELTGHINFVVPSDDPDYEERVAYFLEVEEDRIIELIGGGNSREIRFRLASLAEAKRVVQIYNQSEKTICLPSSPSTSSASGSALAFS